MVRSQFQKIINDDYQVGVSARRTIIEIANPAFSLDLEGIPLESGKIDFRVYKKPLPKLMISKDCATYYLESFYIMDAWKYNLRDKFEQRLAKLKK